MWTPNTFKTWPQSLNNNNRKMHIFSANSTTLPLSLLCRTLYIYSPCLRLCRFISLFTGLSSGKCASVSYSYAWIFFDDNNLILVWMCHFGSVSAVESRVECMLSYESLLLTAKEFIARLFLNRSCACVFVTWCVSRRVCLKKNRLVITHTAIKMCCGLN